MEELIAKYTKRIFLDIKTCGCTFHDKAVLEEGDSMPRIQRRFHKIPDNVQYDLEYDAGRRFPLAKMRLGNIYFKDDLVFMVFEPIRGVKTAYFDNPRYAVSEMSVIYIENGESRAIRSFESMIDFQELQSDKNLRFGIYHVTSHSNDISLLLDGIPKNIYVSSYAYI